MGHPANLKVDQGWWLSPLRGEVEGWERGDDLLGFEGDGDDLADEAEDVAFIVFAVGVVGDAGGGRWRRGTGR